MKLARDLKEIKTKINGIMKKTKIVATIGPVSMSKIKLKKMVQAGMNVCRLNFSHSDHFWHKKAIANIRSVEKTLGKKIGILADLQGPRIRIDQEKSVVVKMGEKVFLTSRGENKIGRYRKVIFLDWVHFWQYLKPGDKIFVEDGRIQLEVMEVLLNGCVTEVVMDGEVKPRKAVNIPAISKYMKTLTDKDIADLEFAVRQKVDMIALSFVASDSDLKLLRRLIKYYVENKKIKWTRKGGYGQLTRGKAEGVTGGYFPWIISKIERAEAIKNLNKILKLSDGVMIARGDLAIEMPQEKVALLELDILRKARRLRKPTIVATQMLASMEEENRPTRAEIADVTGAVINHTDAVMLSGETAMGKYPVLTVETMAKIIVATEKSKYNDVFLRKTKFAKLIFGENYFKNRKKIKQKTAKDLKELLRFSSLRQERLRLFLSKRCENDLGKATLVWGVE